MQTVERWLPRLEKESRSNPKLKPQYQAIQETKEFLDSGTPLFNKDENWKIINLEYLKELQLLSSKPIIYVFNVSEQTLANTTKKQNLANLVLPNKALFICAKLEDELRGLDEIDRKEMLASYGQNTSGLNQIIHTAYDILGLQSYLTAGQKEVRAWTINKGATAPQAAGIIHGDFEKGFIAAQIVNYDDLVTAGNEQAAKAAGKVRTEGKTYIMQPDDVVEFRFNV